jgi:hypothetical protein
MCTYTTTPYVSAAVASEEYVVGARAFLDNQCNMVNTTTSTGCATVGGTSQTVCTGWLLAGTDTACTAACQVLEDVNPGSCSQLQNDFCMNNALAQNLGDCSCINIQNSSFPIAYRGNYSYAGFLDFLSTTFGLNATTSLAPYCWWPACGPGNGIGANNFWGKCPTQVQSCVNFLQCVDINNVNNNSQFPIQLKNNCSVNEPGTPVPVCQSPVIPVNLKNINPSATILGKFDVFDLLCMGILGLVVFILFLAMAVAAAKVVAAKKQVRKTQPVVK